MKVFSTILVFYLGLIQCQSIKHKTKLEKSAPVFIENSNSPEFSQNLWSAEQRREMARLSFLIAEYKSMKYGQVAGRLDYQRAYNLDANPYLGGKYILATAENGELRPALLEAKRLSLLYPSDSETHFLLGSLYRRDQKFQKAIFELTRAIELGMQREEVYLELFEIYMEQKSVHLAIEHAKTWLNTLKSSVYARLSLAKAYLAADMPANAVNFAEQAYTMQSLNIDAALIYALALELSGQATKAIPVYEQIYQHDPYNDSLAKKLVELYQASGEVEHVIELLKNLEKRYPKARLAISVQVISLLWKLEKYAEARQRILTTQNEIADDNKEDFWRLKLLEGINYEYTEEHREAALTYEQIPADSEFYTQAQIRLADLAQKSSEFEAAAQILDNLRDQKDLGVDFYILRARVYAQMKQYSAAVILLSGAEIDFPQSSRILFWKAVYAERNRDYELAEEAIKKYLVNEPDDPTALNFLGYLYADLNKNLSQAEVLIKRALELREDDLYFLDSLAWVYYRQGKLQQSLKLLKKVEDGLGKEFDVALHLAEVYLALNQLDKAKAYLELAGEIVVDDHQKDRLKKLRDMFP